MSKDRTPYAGAAAKSEAVLTLGQYIVRVAILRVTPEMAATWLSKSTTHNRANITSELQQMAAEMAAERFLFNGETIIFDPAENILDGHHRLKACVQSQHPFVTLAVFGVDRAVMPTQDNGTSRTRAHILQFAGVDQASDMAVLARWVWLAENRMLESVGQSSRAAGFFPQTMMEVVERHPRMIDSVRAGGAMNKKFPPVGRSMFAFADYWFSRFGADEARAFCERVSTGDGLRTDDAVFLFRQRMIGEVSRKAKLPSVERLALLIKSWRADFHGAQLRNLKWREDESFPECDPRA